MRRLMTGRWPADKALPRRVLLRCAGAGGAGLAAAIVAACGGDRARTTSQGQTPATVAVGRSGGTQEPAETAQAGGTLNWFEQANPPTLDPHRTSAVTTMRTVSPTLSRLLRFKSVRDVEASYNLETDPDLALSLESPDAVTWTVKLRPNAKFHNVPPVNGHAVEAEDVKATFTRAFQPGNPNAGSLTMMDPAQIETPSRDTVVFRLKYPYAPFPKFMASGVYSWIMPREAAAGAYDPAKQIIGSGPYVFESYTPDVAMVYKKNPEWFEQGRPYMDGVRRAIVPDAAQRLAQFTGGNLDTVGVPIQDLDSMKQRNAKAEVIAQWDQGGPVLYFQLGEPSSPFQDVRLRRAASLAINREAFGKALLNNQWSQAFNVPRNQGKWSIKLEDLPAETQQWYKFDLERAKRLLEEAGATNMNVKILYPTPHPRDPYLKTAAETVSSMLSALPWKVSFVLIDYNKDWVAGGKGVRYGNFPSDSIVVTGIEGRTDVDEYLYGWWHSKSTSSISRLNDPMVDAMIDRGRTLLKEEERVKAAIETQKYLLDKTYAASGQPSGLDYTMVQPWLRNYTVGDSYGMGTSAFAQAWLKK
jgi:peptide/nickel transport system substrate-binding protein